MRFAEGVLELAARRRRKLFDRLGDDVGVVVALDPANKAYVSGYHSMTHDVAPAYRSAAVATRDGVVLVVGAADAGPALEFVADPRQLYRYGTFFFASAGDGLHFSAEGPAFATFADALSAALAATAPAGGPVAIDRPDPAVVVPGRYRWQTAADAFVASRATKLAGEIERMRAATALAEAGIRAVAAEARVGSTEWELAALIGHEMMRGGAVPRFVVVASGHRAALADAYPSHRPIAPGDLVRIDIGCSVDGYWTDIARTMVVGEPSPMVARRHAAIEAGLATELSLVRAGSRAAELFEATVASVRAAGIANYHRNHCGHGIGLAGYEHPTIEPASDAILESGMCLCVETPYYEIGWGGMMVEDLVVVEDAACRSLTTLDRSLVVIAA